MTPEDVLVLADKAQLGTLTPEDFVFSESEALGPDNFGRTSYPFLGGYETGCEVWVGDDQNTPFDPIVVRPKDTSGVYLSIGSEAANDYLRG